jgi:hypothetical protein
LALDLLQTRAVFILYLIFCLELELPEKKRRPPSASPEPSRAPSARATPEAALNCRGCGSQGATGGSRNLKLIFQSI